MKDRELFVSSIIFLCGFVFFAAIVFSPLKNVFSPIVTMTVLIYLLSPPIRLMKKMKINSVASTLAVYAAIIGAAIFAAVVAYPKLCEAVLKTEEIAKSFAQRLGIQIKGESLVAGGANGLYKTVVWTIKTVTDAVVGATAAFYVLADEERVKKSLGELIPTKLKPSFKILLDDVKVSFDSFFKGQALIALVLFAMDGVFLYIMKIPYALGLSAIAALLDIVPYIGATAAMAMIVLVCAVAAPKKALAVFVGLMIIQQIENNMVTPKISADTMRIHPSITVVVLYLGSFGGFWGILLSIPLACVLKKIFERLVQALI